MNKIAFIFPGQGAQYVGMAKDFYDAYPIVRETFEEASKILSFDFTKLILEGPESELTLTKNSQPAIFIVSVAILRVIQQQYPQLQPSVCAGLSLGEYTALYACGRISFADALQIVAARGKYMQEACEEQSGSMRVVLGLDPQMVAAHLPENIWVANLNCPGQVVIAGLTSAMPAAEEQLKAQGAKRVLPLEVSGAFHTPLMRSAQEKLKSQLLSVSLKESSIQFVMNVPGDFVDFSFQIRDYLIAQVASPTQWEKGIRLLDDVDFFIEIGPGRTLSGMNKKIGVKGQMLNIEKTPDLAQLAQLYVTSPQG
ncbi:MAG TPA: ACP S-malonyltransferase [Rhabdochlamydiaceae bacterium]|jgi:[acyl-carrier-protein] S-malonyltransferase|nr:ACP S-malonyltransferase [Rhabdochlamydiaceae bacterium]